MASKNALGGAGLCAWVSDESELGEFLGMKAVCIWVC